VQKLWTHKKLYQNSLPPCACINKHIIWDFSANILSESWVSDQLHSGAREKVKFYMTSFMDDPNLLRRRIVIEVGLRREPDLPSSCRVTSTSSGSSTSSRGPTAARTPNSQVCEIRESLKKRMNRKLFYI
jgi:hypothetical protein